jgi:hypothetical protein
MLLIREEQLEALRLGHIRAGGRELALNAGARFPKLRAPDKKQRIPP